MFFFFFTIHFWVTFYALSVPYFYLFNSLMVPKVNPMKRFLPNDGFCMQQTKLKIKSLGSFWSILLYFIAYCANRLNKNIATKICCLLMNNGTGWLLSLCATSPVKVLHIISCLIQGNNPKLPREIINVPFQLVWLSKTL